LDNEFAFYMTVRYNTYWPYHSIYCLQSDAVVKLKIIPLYEVPGEIPYNDLHRTLAEMHK